MAPIKHTDRDGGQRARSTGKLKLNSEASFASRVFSPLIREFKAWRARKKEAAIVVTKIQFPITFDWFLVAERSAAATQHSNLRKINSLRSKMAYVSFFVLKVKTPSRIQPVSNQATSLPTKVSLS